MFIPTTGPAATAQIQPDGTYLLTTFSAGDGAVLGPHKVTIDAKTFEGPLDPPPKSFEEEKERVLAGRSTVPQKQKWIVPEKYARSHTSPLTATVERGENVVDFKLPPP
jgi:hypothetical protein